MQSVGAFHAVLHILTVSEKKKERGRMGTRKKAKKRKDKEGKLCLEKDADMEESEEKKGRKEKYTI